MVIQTLELIGLKDDSILEEEHYSVIKNKDKLHSKQVQCTL